MHIRVVVLNCVELPAVQKLWKNPDAVCVSAFFVLSSPTVAGIGRAQHIPLQEEVQLTLKVEPN